MPAKNKILVVGSVAYDNLMRFDGEFKNVMVNGKHSFAVTVSGRDISYGGCGGNIAYSLNLLGEMPMLMSSVGRDFGDYGARFGTLGISTGHLTVSKKHLTASAFICTDSKENQVTFFDAGAMGAVSETPGLKTLKRVGIAWAIISPDNATRMINAARACKKLDIPFVFDPGQQIPFYKVSDLKWAVNNCTVLVLNDYEAGLLSKTLKVSKQALSGMMPVYIETLGDKGSLVKIRGDGTFREGSFTVPAVKPARILDPTGCGDAFRAGLLTALKHKLSIKKAVQAGALVATYKLEKPGTQNHRFTRKQFNKRYRQNFGVNIF